MSSRKRKNKKDKFIPNYVDNINIQFDFEKVKNLAKRKGIEVILKCDGKVLEFKSKYDTWIVPIDSDLIRVYHDEKNGRRHIQSWYWDYEYMINSTEEHDYYRKRLQGGNRVDNVMYKYNNGLIPRFKVN